MILKTEPFWIASLVGLTPSGVFHTPYVFNAETADEAYRKAMAKCLELMPITEFGSHSVKVKQIEWGVGSDPNK